MDGVEGLSYDSVSLPNEDRSVKGITLKHFLKHSVYV